MKIQMNNKPIKNWLMLVLLWVGLSSPWISVQALEQFEKAGVVTAINQKGFFIENQKFRLAANIKVIGDTPTAKTKKISEIKKGDLVWAKGRVLDGIRYIEIIRYFERQPS